MKSCGIVSRLRLRSGMMTDAKIYGFIRAVEGYLAEMAERGDWSARALLGMAGEILEQIEGEA
jgi:hypothetical protein